MALDTYRSKRDFAKTREPAGKTREPKGKARHSETHLFVVQKHAARRLHYDLRLELDGVLKSWAVTKGPSLVPGEKRLAVAVEDHPLDYADFEGTIPKGEYGGGTVIVWDKGSWRPLHDPAKGLAKGHLDFELAGGKLNGRWHLVRMAGKPGEKHQNWLLIKGDDESARSESEADILDERPDSAKTGRSLDEVAEGAPAPGDRLITPSKIKGADKAATPRFIEPELASLAAGPPEGDKWIHEIKFDGYRLQARKDSDSVTLLTRSGLDWTERFGAEINDALRALPVEQAVFDGELVVENANGASDFSALQNDLSEGRSDRFRFYLFDLLSCDGYDLRAAALIDRKALLENILAGRQSPLRYSEHFEESGALVFRHVCRLSLEGVVSKRKDSPYRSGGGKLWLKSKCIDRQEFVIGGFVPSSTSRKAIGSLALGFYEDGALKYAGRVGTGFSASVAQSLFQKLEPLQIAKSPFAQKLSSDESRQLKPVKPELIAEIEFRAWTADGHLRHASFRGLREDKPASDVQREVATGENSSEPKRKIKLTHADRLYWPDVGVTKEGLADYYAEVWRCAAPFIVGRPLALVRCPTGYAGEQFFQKHPWKGASPALAALHDPKEPESLIGVNDLDGFLALAQGAVLEIHPWGSRADDLERPDLIVMDLDPGDGVGWGQVIAAAIEVRERLQRAGLAAFVKTSGGKGLHVAAPLRPKAEWPEVKAFCKAMADGMAADSPDLYISTIAKKSRTGKIFVDYLRNQRGATAVAPYSPRARAGAPVSMPIDWDELNDSMGPSHFTILNTPARLTTLDTIPWTEFFAQAAPLGAAAPRRKSRMT